MGLAYSRGIPATLALFSSAIVGFPLRRSLCRAASKLRPLHDYGLVVVSLSEGAGALSRADAHCHRVYRLSVLSQNVLGYVNRDFLSFLALAGMFGPFKIGLSRSPRSPLSAILSILIGLGLWLVHYFVDWTYSLEPCTASFSLQPPAATTMAACSLIVYIGADSMTKLSPKR
ncbi:MAG: hypothetical protein BMS9Abin37_1581 [Acidobacteriota bacterium]|nr:MAG: hypothetical protein BMS9Abin37_1581 [Acidobacteriota bacterium]